MSTPSESFDAAMHLIYRRAARECNYRPRIFLQMLEELGGLGTAKRLLGTDQPQFGFEHLWELKRLDLTVEAHVLRNEFVDLFTQQELNEAYRRIIEQDPRFFEHRQQDYSWYLVTRKGRDESRP